MISLIRCDERLIHGQCMQFIVSDYSIKRILVVDNATAMNPVLKTIFTTAVPKALKADVYTVDQATEEIKGAITDSTNTLLLMKNPRTLVQLRKNVSDK